MEHLDASEEAVHKAKNAAQAIEVAREAQLARAVEQTALRTKESLLEGLKEVFELGEPKGEMRVLWSRIPILCVLFEEVKNDVAELKEDARYNRRLIIGGVVSILVAVMVSIIVK